MSPPATHIFNPRANLIPSLLVHLLESWAEADPNPSSILCDLRVTSIMHNKMPNSPEHEFLVVKTEDRDKETRLFILERTVEPGLVTMTGDRPTAMESVKQLCATITTSPSDLASAEEGQLDRLTVSTVQSAKIISDSMDIKGSSLAVDRFMGSSYVFSDGWHGENVRLLQPKKPLSLYQLALIAEAVNTRFPTYNVLKDQCYFHAGVIYSAILYHFGSSLQNPQEPCDITVASNLKYGRYRGVKIKQIDHKDMLLILADYEEAYNKITIQVTRRLNSLVQDEDSESERLL